MLKASKQPTHFIRSVVSYSPEYIINPIKALVHRRLLDGQVLSLFWYGCDTEYKFTYSNCLQLFDFILLLFSPRYFGSFLSRLCIHLSMCCRKLSFCIFKLHFCLFGFLEPLLTLLIFRIFLCNCFLVHLFCVPSLPTIRLDSNRTFLAYRPVARQLQLFKNILFHFLIFSFQILLFVHHGYLLQLLCTRQVLSNLFQSIFPGSVYFELFGVLLFAFLWNQFKELSVFMGEWSKIYICLGLIIYVTSILKHLS